MSLFQKSEKAVAAAVCCAMLFCLFARSAQASGASATAKKEDVSGKSASAENFTCSVDDYFYGYRAVFTVQKGNASYEFYNPRQTPRSCSVRADAASRAAVLCSECYGCVGSVRGYECDAITTGCLTVAAVACVAFCGIAVLGASIPAVLAVGVLFTAAGGTGVAYFMGKALDEAGVADAAYEKFAGKYDS